MRKPRTDLQVLEAAIERLPGVVRFMVAETSTYIELLHVRVAPDKQRSGTGTKAVSMLLDYAAKANVPVVVVPVPDEGKQEELFRFYRKLGFRKVSTERSVEFGHPWGCWVWEPKFNVKSEVVQPELLSA